MEGTCERVRRGDSGGGAEGAASGLVDELLDVVSVELLIVSCLHSLLRIIHHDAHRYHRQKQIQNISVKCRTPAASLRMRCLSLLQEIWGNISDIDIIIIIEKK